MKSRREQDYYLGLDIGTESVGYAVTDENYNILKFNGKTCGEAGCLTKLILQLKEEHSEVVEDDFKDEHGEYSFYRNCFLKKYLKLINLFCKNERKPIDING